MSELKHYGVVGMRWGVRRSSEFKAARAASQGKSPDSRRKLLTEAREKALIRQQPFLTACGAKRIAGLGLGQIIAQQLFVGNLGATVYNEMRAGGISKGKSWVAGLMASIGNATLANGPGMTMDVAKWVSRKSIRPNRARPKEEHRSFNNLIKRKPSATNP